jgi:hypothetical protein
MHRKIEERFSHFSQRCKNRKNKILQLLKSIGLYRTGKLFALLGFIYQLIDSTLTYCEYETVFKLKEEIHSQEIPSISVCINSYEEFLRITKAKNKNETFGEYIYRSIDCTIIEDIYSLKTQQSVEKICNKTQMVESITPHALRCITYFSQIFDSIGWRKSSFLVTLTAEKNTIRRFVTIVHQSKTLPHFFNEYVTHKLKHNYIIELQSSKEQEIIIAISLSDRLLFLWNKFSRTEYI